MDSRNCSLEIPQRRDVTLDIAKALCIILMVVGHSGCPDYLHRFIYMFHMPCFFFISGWLLSDKYATDLKTGLLKKVKGYYKPFIKWELIFLLCHNLFAWLHIYNDSYPLRDIPLKAVRIFTMTGGEQLLGGFWFLISIFWASVAALLFVALLHRRKCLTIFNIWGGNFNAITCHDRRIHTHRVAGAVWLENHSGNGLLHDRLRVQADETQL